MSFVAEKCSVKSLRLTRVPSQLKLLMSSTDVSDKSNVRLSKGSLPKQLKHLISSTLVRAKSSAKFLRFNVPRQAKLDTSLT